VVCGLLLVGLLVAGLWPFHSPGNQVTWSAGSNGLRFGRHGTILSLGKFEAPNVPADAPCSIEIWFEPGLTSASGTLFSFYTPGNPRVFSLNQALSDLALRSTVRNGPFRSQTTRLYVRNIFHRGKPVFVTVTSKGGHTSIYVDGALARTGPLFPLSSQDFSGKLIIANFPRIDNSWTGVLRGLAFYDEEISPAQVLHHYETWVEQGRPDISENDRAVAVYLFDERAGRVIHNQVFLGTDLYIPEHFLVLDQVFLRPFWETFHASWSYWDDVLVNIAGFIPFGFLFCAYLSLAGRSKRPAWITILLGFTVSFTIEALQVFLPTRDSDTTDIITNILGTCLGVWLYRISLRHVIIARFWANNVGTKASGEPHQPDRRR